MVSTVMVVESLLLQAIPASGIRFPLPSRASAVRVRLSPIPTRVSDAGVMVMVPWVVATVKSDVPDTPSEVAEMIADPLESAVTVPAVSTDATAALELAQVICRPLRECPALSVATASRSIVSPGCACAELGVTTTSERLPTLWAVKTTTESFMLRTRGWPSEARARASWAPMGPKVQAVRRYPAPSVLPLTGEADPPPATTLNSRRTPETGSPRRSTTRTVRLSPSGWPCSAVCPEPVT